MRRRFVAIALLACGAFGCTADALTEIVVVVDSDLRVPEDIDRIDIDVIAPDGEEQTARADLGAGEPSLPRQIGLVHRGGPLGPLTITATGRLSGDVVIERTARVSFLRERTVVLRMDLLRDCLALVCEEGESCAEGGCRPIDVELTEDAGPVVVPPPVEGADAAADTGPADASSEAGPNVGADAGPDAGSDSAVEGGSKDGGGTGGRPDAMSPGPVTCAMGDVCSLTCTSGGCDFICQRGSECDIACAKGDCHVACAVDATCDVECAGGNCDIDCQKDATCTIADCTAGGCACTGQGSCP